DNIALEIERLLYQGECNCAYWHGSFGGLYLSHLRHALYSALIKGEKILEEALNENQKWLNITIADYDRDLSDEITLSNPELTVIVDCNYGGSLLNLDYKPEAFALSNTIRRRKEFYHKKIETIASSNDGDQPRSIHDFVQAKEEGLEDFLQYDKYLRRSFLEYLFVSDIDFETFNKGEYENIEGITDAPYNITKLKNKDGSTIPLINANFRLPVEPQINLDISKEFVMNDQDPSLEVRYQLSSDKLSNREFFFLTELNFNLLTDQSDDRYWSAGNIENQRPLLRETLIEDDVTKVGLVDDYFKFEIIVSSSTPITVWRYPIYTISQSEGGFERTYQGSTLMLKRKIRFLQDEKVSFSIKVEINKRD
ncbi:MAG: alpha-amylase/4-alpha-glucanotransferase domain-containing protein, partial [Nitrospinota bacterium]